jgi:hypothetical protein
MAASVGRISRRYRVLIASSPPFEEQANVCLNLWDLECAFGFLWAVSSLRPRVPVKSQRVSMRLTTSASDAGAKIPRI